MSGSLPEKTVFLVILDVLFADLGSFEGREAILWSENALLSPNKFTLGRLRG